MKRQLHIAYDPIYAHPLPEGHRFPMLKYELIPGQLIHEGSIRQDQLFAPSVCEDSIILQTHTPEYLFKLNQLLLTDREQRAIGFPQTEALIRREKIITQGTIDCCTYALQHGVALNVAGGTHHAFADHGEGFCLLNDMAVAANHLLYTKKVRQILIVDLDVHQGNGTAKIFSQEPRVFTFSMHGAHNYPFRKEVSDCDVPLADGTDSETYLHLLNAYLSQLLDQVQPDFVFYLSGVDILNTDRFGKLDVTPEGCSQRDQMVFSFLKARQLPCVVAMGGGYSADVKVITEAHCQTFRLAASVYELD